MSTDLVTLERRIDARPETVFSFFTDPNKWLSWMGQDGEFSFRPGGAYRTTVTGQNIAEGHFVEVDPPKRLVFTWGWVDNDLGVPPGSTTVEITLEPDAEGTLLRLVHRDLPSPQARAAHKDGWIHYTDRLATLAEGGNPGPDTWT
ncbi:SRPBCC domain-containing protein [Streptomyces sp. NBC_00885]|uniref:SRPBCC family protein n=1 Tax=Streptomyces sp. NBC_00885 TaxID=2975857 RepID=UPI00386DEE94|nr:SRPBCC domain-containing protein [Streptomyces sp. NBC_00885]